MKNVMTLGFVLALALGASGLSASTVGANATGSKTVKVRPVAIPGPVAVPHRRPNSR
jgi:hypothetical protein